MCGVLVAASSICACASILGIDDGKPREPDASIPDVSVPETTPDVVIVDVGVDVPTSPLVCGTSTCNALVEGCCRTSDPADASAYSFDCVSDAASCSGGLIVTCDESANCTALGQPGTVCCAVVPDGGSVATSTQCLPYLDCFGAFMCQPGDDEMCNSTRANRAYRAR